MKRPLCFICLAFVLTIYCYMEWSPLPTNHLEQFVGKEIKLYGQIYQKELKNDQFIIYLEKVTFCDNQIPNFQEQNNKIMCYMATLPTSFSEPKIGMKVELNGTLQTFQKATNPGEFDLQKYYHLYGIDHVLKQSKITQKTGDYCFRKEMLYEIKKHFVNTFEKTLDDKDASIMKAMLLGEKQNLDKEIKQIYQKAGIAHILAISGLHISLLGMGLYKLLKKMKVHNIIAITVCILIMSQYGEMTGMESSAYRAIFMFSFRMIAIVLKRSYDLLTAMVISCMLLLFEQPLYIYHAGFQLSFGAILGIGLFSKVFVFQKNNRKEKLEIKNCPILQLLYTKVKTTIKALQENIGLFVIQFPIILTQYYTFPIYSFLLNLLIIPMMGIVLGLGLMMLFLGTFSIKVAALPAMIVHIVLKMFEYLAASSLKLPVAKLIIGLPEWYEIAIYISIVVIIGAFAKKISIIKRYIILMIGILILINPYSFYDKITMLDVGQGDGICISTKAGHHYFIDGGSTSKNDLATYQMIPFLKHEGIRQLDAVFLTHLDQDHISGIEEMLKDNEEIKIKKIVLSKAVVKDVAYQKLIELCHEKNISVTYMCEGDYVKNGDMTITCLYPKGNERYEDRNEASLALYITSNQFGSLFCGDITEKGEQELCEKIRNYDSNRIQVMKASHHGSSTSNSEELLDCIKPEVEIISCGLNNRYGHPHKEVIERLRERNIRIYQTSRDGAITIKIYKSHFCIIPFLIDKKKGVCYNREQKFENDKNEIERVKMCNELLKI